MSLQRINCFILAFVLFASLAFSQNLAEVAKKEKERRASLKGEKSILVTNADLKKVSRQPAVSFDQSPEAPVADPERTQAPRPAPVSEGEYPPPRMERNSRNSREPTYSVEESDNPAETVEMLTRKMNYLQQKFYTFTDWTLRDDIQREMVKTYEKLQKALEAEKKSGGKKGKQRIKDDG